MKFTSKSNDRNEFSSALDRIFIDINNAQTFANYIKLFYEEMDTIWTLKGNGSESKLILKHIEETFEFFENMVRTGKITVLNKNDIEQKTKYRNNQLAVGFTYSATVIPKPIYDPNQQETLFKPAYLMLKNHILSFLINPQYNNRILKKAIVVAINAINDPSVFSTI